MINELCKELEKYLPLSIEEAFWNYPQLHIHGKGWGFSTMAAWRIHNNNKLIFGSDEEDASAIINNLKNLQLVSLRTQSVDPHLDPVFVFSDGSILEIFSTFYLEPWIFRLPSGSFYNGDPTDSNWVKQKEIR